MKNKKLFLIIIISIITFILPITISNVYAEEKVNIESINIIEKTDTTTILSEPSIDNLEINFNLSFSNVKDYAKYKIVIDNPTNKDYELDKEITNTSNYLTYKTEFENDYSIINKKSKITFYITIAYNIEVETDNLVNGKYIVDNIVRINLSDNEKTTIEIIKNAETKSNILIVVITLILIMITTLILYNKTKKRKYLNIIILSLLIIPISIYALEKIQISINTKIAIEPVEGCFNFVNDSSGGGGNAEMSGLTLMMKNATQGEDDNSWFANTAINQNQAGIYTRAGTSNDRYPIYYYRGKYDQVNNNLIFNNFCWKIIRTTATGGIRIIYNGPATNNQCTTQFGATTTIGSYAFNTETNDAKYLRYQYDDNGVLTDSNLKSVLDNWYNTNMSEVDNKIETSIYCNDMSEPSSSQKEETGLIGEQIYYCGVYRAYKSTPTTLCSKSSDAYSTKVGFVTIDEVMLSGRNWIYTSRDDYLYNNSIYWIGSPYFYHISGFTVMFGSASNINNCYLTNIAYAVRPVVTLLPNTSYTGTGTTIDPFVVN